MSFDHKVFGKFPFIALVIAFVVHCGGGGGGGGGPTDPPLPPAPTAVAVTTSRTSPLFVPANTSLAVGGTVTWTNPSPATHNLTATTRNWVLARTLEPGQSFAATVTQAGIYRYECSLHPGMTGSIEVR